MLRIEASPELHIEPLGRHPQLVPVLTAWHVPEFDPDGSLDQWLEAHTREARISGVPCAWVAFADATPVGSVSLIEHNMDTHQELTPWLAALFVLPSHRGRGIGTALVRRCEEEAWATGANRMYLYTSPARHFYARLGWSTLAEDVYEGKPVTIMVREAQKEP
jgi:predicted N-acetyltransferase YhbS